MGCRGETKTNKKHVIVLILTAILVISLQPVVAVAGKPDKPPRKPEEPKPEIPPLKLNDMNIVTAEPDGDGRLRVWGYTGGDPAYGNIWIAENVHYDSVAIGDVDNDDEIEIVGTTGYKVTVWKRSAHVKEDRVFWGNEIIITDVDPSNENGNEVIMITPHRLVVYTYDGDFNIMSCNNFPEYLSTVSVTVGDLDNDENKEILVSVIRPGSDHENEGYLYVFDYGGSNLNLLLNPPIEIDARLNRESLRVGDLNGDGTLEICSTGYRKIGDLYEAYIFIWNHEGIKILDELLLLLLDRTIAPYWTLDVGQLDSDSYDEIALEMRKPNPEIKLYSFTNNLLEEICTIPIDEPSVIRGNVLIADSDDDGDNEIVVYGSCRSDRSSNTGRFYLEVFDYQVDQWASIWDRVGGEYGEFEVWDAAVG